MSKTAAKQPNTVPFTAEEIALKGQGFFHKGREFISHTGLPHNESAFHNLLRPQKLLLAGSILALMAFLALDWHLTIVAVLAVLTVLYFADLLFNCFLIYRSFTRAPEIHIPAGEIAAMPAADWPAYSIFCPLYKEWQVLPQFVDAMQAMDYPKDKLQVLLLLEEDDQETIARAKDPHVIQVMAGLGSEYDVVMIVGSDGRLAADIRPLVRLSVTVIVARPHDGQRLHGFLISF